MKVLLGSISAVLIVFRLKGKQNALIRNMVALDHVMPHIEALKEINKIVEYAKKEVKEQSF